MHIRGKEPVHAATLLHNLIESRLVDRQVLKVPLRDALLVQVHDLGTNAEEANDPGTVCHRCGG